MNWALDKKEDLLFKISERFVDENERSSKKTESGQTAEGGCMNRERWLWIGGVLALAAIAYLGYYKDMAEKNVGKLDELLSIEQAKVIAIQKEAGDAKKTVAELEKKLADKSAPAPIPEGKELVDKEQIKIWNKCCADLVAQKTQKELKNVAPAPKKKVLAKKAFMPATSSPPPAVAVPAPPKPAPVSPPMVTFSPPKGECFELTLPQGN